MERVKGKNWSFRWDFSQVFKKLIEEGLISEEIDKKDRRKKIYKLIPTEKTFELSLQRVIAKLFLIYLRSVLEENEKMEDLERKTGKIVLICLFGGDRGKEICRIMVENFQEFMKDLESDIPERYNREFNELWEDFSKEIMELFKSELRIDPKLLDPKKYWIRFDIDTTEDD